MSLEKLGKSLHEALRKVLRAPAVDEKLVKELVRDFQRALLQADVNVQLVLDLSKRIEQRALKDEIPPGASRRDYVVKVVYEELARLLGDKPRSMELEKGGGIRKVLLVGIQGSGKTTSAIKLARFYAKRGFRVGVVCADTYRPGALEQLKQLGEKGGIPVYGEERAEDSIKVALNGVRYFDQQGFDLAIVDTAGRHKDEASLLKEMEELANALNPDHVVLVIDATIGQQALSQAEAFHKAAPIGGIVLSKLDGSAKGGGAISAVAATGAPIYFVGTGEGIDNLEPFDPQRFVGRLLGLGDLQGLLERFRELEQTVSREKAKAIVSGRFTLEDMLDQLGAVRKLGPISSLLNKLPMLGYSIPKEAMEEAEHKIDRWKAIILSMTPEERENPKILNPSRMRRIARGSGTSEREVKELIEQYNMAKKMMRQLAKKRGAFRRGLPLGFPAA